MLPRLPADAFGERCGRLGGADQVDDFAAPHERLVEIASKPRLAVGLACGVVRGELRLTPVPALEEAVAQRAASIALRPVVAARDVEHAGALRAVAFAFDQAAHRLRVHQGLGRGAVARADDRAAGAE